MLRSILKINTIKRLASTIPKTKISTLPNGMTVATEFIPNTSSATVGVFVDAGSRAENIQNNGTDFDFLKKYISIFFKI